MRDASPMDGGHHLTRAAQPNPKTPTRASRRSQCCRPRSNLSRLVLMMRFIQVYYCQRQQSGAWPRTSVASLSSDPPQRSAGSRSNGVCCSCCKAPGSMPPLSRGGVRMCFSRSRLSRMLWPYCRPISGGPARHPQAHAQVHPCSGSHVCSDTLRIISDWRRGSEWGS